MVIVAVPHFSSLTTHALPFSIVSALRESCGREGVMDW
jgi:hypothetical protein